MTTAQFRHEFAFILALPVPVAVKTPGPGPGRPGPPARCPDRPVAPGPADGPAAGRACRPARGRGRRRPPGRGGGVADRSFSIALFAALVVVTLGITWWASRRTRSATDFYAAGRRISGWQNGV